MTRFLRRAVLAALICAPAVVLAADGTLAAADAWTRPGLPNRPHAIYLTLTNGGAEGAVLTGASSPAFERIEMHLSEESGGVMTMQPVASVDVPAGGTAMFEPGGLHLMAFGPAVSLKEGDSFTLSLAFEAANAVEVTVTVMPMSHGAGHRSDHGS